MHNIIAARAVCAALLTVAAVAHAQQPYPSKALRIINPLAPGGTTDITARTLAPQLSTFLGQPVVVENRTGAGGVVGAEFVAKSPPDGYTMLLMSGDSYNVNAAMYPKLPFDARKDLKPVTLLAASPNMLSVHPSLPVKSVKELVALSKTRPKELNYGVGGTAGLIRMETLKMNTGLMITNVPYKGSGPALIDLMAGHIHAGFFNSVATIPYVQSGRLRGLMLSGTKRSERVPDVPTAREVGVNGFDENAGYMIMVPSATPPDIVARLNKELVRSLQTPELKGRFAAEGAEIIGSSHEQAVARQNREIEEWAQLITKTGIKLN